MPQPLHRPEDPMAAHLTALYDRVARLERRKQGGSFDPNEDPVIIGLGASAGNSSTPDAVSAGVTGSVILGRFASASDTAPVIAIGDGAAAPGDGTASSATAIGNSATASGANAIALGDVATASAHDAIAVGDNATASGISSIAIGALASAAHASAVAIGAGATATAANQIVLGTSSETIIIKGTIDGSHLPTSNPGAGSKKVWNNGGVVTVA